MLKVDILLELLRSLDAHVNTLEKLRPASMEVWKEDIENYWAVLHGLQLAIQHVIDISAHILAGQNLSSPADYREALSELGRHKIIPVTFAEKIEGMAGLRNILVHRYLGVDPQKVFKAVDSDLDDFRTFIAYIEGYLRREGHLPSEEQGT